MKRTIISWIIGVIFGIVGCVAAIAAVFKKLCNSMLIREEIISSIKNVITIALFGSKRVTYTNSYTGRPNKYSASYYYIKEAVRRVEEVKFDSHKEVVETVYDIRDMLNKCKGEITVERVLDIIYGGTSHTEKYLDKLFGWDSPDSFKIGTTGFSESSKYYIHVIDNPYKLDNEERRKDDMYVQASASEVQRQ